MVGWLLTLTVIASILLGLAGLLAGVAAVSRRSGQDETLTSRHGRSGCRRWCWRWCGVIAGVVPWVLDAPLSAAAAAILNTPPTMSLAMWHGVLAALLLSALTLLGVAVAYVARDVDSRAARGAPARGTERSTPAACRRSTPSAG